MARTPSHEVARRSRDSDPTGPGRSLVPPDPYGVSTPSGFSSDRTSDDRSRRGPSCAFVPLQRSIAGVPRRSAGTRPAGRTALPLLSLPALRHTLGTADPNIGGRSLRHLVTRPGFGYPHRVVHHRPYRRARRRSVPGLRPSRPRSPPRRCPSRGLCLPDVSRVLADRPLRGRRRDASRLQGVALAAERSAPTR